MENMKSSFTLTVIWKETKEWTAAADVALHFTFLYASSSSYMVVVRSTSEIYNTETQKRDDRRWIKRAVAIAKESFIFYTEWLRVEMYRIWWRKSVPATESMLRILRYIRIRRVSLRFEAYRQCSITKA